jgi:formate hydrogenlyase subunit 3/multisubunit Na+/H+ antiporter MnhD subunit
MVLLQEAISARPFLILAVFLLVAGFGSAIYTLFRITKSANKKYSGSRQQAGEKRNTSKALVVLLIIILIALIVFINWLGKIKYD